MKLLSVETATEACSAALMIDDEIISRFRVAPRKHTELILPMCDELMNEAGVNPSQLDAIAFGRGPGSFTGVRIAAGVAQGIAFAHDLPVVPVSTLATMAQEVVQTKGQTHVLSVIDARMDEVYWGAYVADSDGLASLCGEEIVASPDKVPIPESAQWYGAGNGWQTYSDNLRVRLGYSLSDYDDQLLPKAEYMLILSRQDLQKGLAVSVENALPVYLRNKVTHQRKR